jgi:FKBP-type peptidyl-prolyl cis-trans isomerase
MSDMQQWMKSGRRLVTVASMALVSVVAVGCAESTTEFEAEVVPESEFQVIEDVSFNAALGIDLDSMTRLPTGVYWKDLVVGNGTPALQGTTPLVTYTLWLTDGSEVETGQFSFLFGNNRVISGFEDGLLSTNTGGTRLIVIPPNRGYGGATRYDQFGNVTIPGGSVLIFEVTVDSIIG